MRSNSHTLRAMFLAAIVALIVTHDFAHYRLFTQLTSAQTRGSWRVKSLLLVGRVEKNSFRENETIALKVSLKNRTRETVYVTESNALADYKIEVRKEDGTLAPPTEEGQKQLTLSLWSTRRLSVAIAPGQEMSQTFEINKIYAMPAGIYNISVRRKVTTEWRKKTVELPSNVVRVEVNR